MEQTGRNDGIVRSSLSLFNDNSSDESALKIVQDK